MPPNHGFPPNMQGPPPDFYPNAPPPPGPFPPSSMHLNQAMMPPLAPVSGASAAVAQPHVPFPHPLMAPHDPLVEEIRPPYFDMPAGIMTMYVKIEDFDYKPIDPNEVRIPPVTPPTERLTKAIEAFYAPPSHEHPRNSEGWEKLGLYEFFRTKSKARQEYEEKEGHQPKKEDDDVKETSNGLVEGGSSKSTSDNVAKVEEEERKKRTPSPPKRRYKEFKEDKDVSKSTSKSVKKSRSRSRSPSPKYREARPHKSKRSRSRSRSRSKSPHRSRRGKQLKGRSPPSGFKPVLRKSRSISPPPAFQPFR